MKRELVKPLTSTDGKTHCAYVDPVLAFMYPTLVLGYPERLDPTRLREALAQVLDDYSVVSGRMVHSQTGWHIEHGAGALFETAESTQTCEALGNAVRGGHSKLACPHYSLAATLRRKAPLFGVRLTHTADGSLLGVTWNHALGDFHSLMMVLRAWSLACHDEAYPKPLEVSDREAFLLQHAPAERPQYAGWRVLSWLEMLRMTFRRVSLMRDARRVALDFSWEQIAAIQAAATSDRPVSAADALCAYIFQTLHRLGDDISPEFAILMNYRKMLDLPANLLCNCSDVVRTVAEPNDDHGAIAANLRTSIEAFDAGSLSHREVDALLTSEPRVLGAARLARAVPGAVNLVLSNVSRSGLHRLSFGSTPPSFVHSRATDHPVFGAGVLFPTSGERGLTVDIVLTSKLLARLKSDNSSRMCSFDRSLA
jgi:hypothetical protein